MFWKSPPAAGASSPLSQRHRCPSASLRCGAPGCIRPARHEEQPPAKPTADAERHPSAAPCRAEPMSSPRVLCQSGCSQLAPGPAPCHGHPGQPGPGWPQHPIVVPMCSVHPAALRAGAFIGAAGTLPLGMCNTGNAQGSSCSSLSGQPEGS